MTATFATVAEVSPVRRAATTVTRSVTTVASPAVPASSTSSVLVDSSKAPHWLKSTLLKIIDWAREADPTDLPQMSRCVKFLTLLSYSVPEPFVALGDDGSIGIEWDKRDKHLHMTFSSDQDEVFWLDVNTGAEWEASLKDAAHILNDLLRVISSY